MENDKNDELKRSMYIQSEIRLQEARRKQRCWQELQIHSSSNISKEGKTGREATTEENEEQVRKEEGANDFLNLSFKKTELNRPFKEILDISTM